MDHKEAGRLGGLATLAKHGRDHFIKIGKKGARSFHDKYVLVPYRINNFMIVERETGQVINTLFYEPERSFRDRFIERINTQN